MEGGNALGGRQTRPSKGTKSTRKVGQPLTKWLFTLLKKRVNGVRDLVWVGARDILTRQEELQERTGPPPKSVPKRSNKSRLKGMKGPGKELRSKPQGSGLQKTTGSSPRKGEKKDWAPKGHQVATGPSPDKKK